MKQRKAAARALRRERERQQAEHVKDMERLARLEPGGCSERLLPIDSPMQVDVIANARPCPLCGGSLLLREHAAETHAGHRLRVARVGCTTCGIGREVWFELTSGRVH